jgi:hypothetical protein
MAQKDASNGNGGGVASVARVTQEAEEHEQLSLQVPSVSMITHNEAQQMRLHSLLVMQEVTHNVISSVTRASNVTIMTDVFRHKRTEFVIDSGASIPVTPHPAAVTNAHDHLTEIMIGNSTVVVSYMIGDMGSIRGTRVLTDAPTTVVPISAFTDLGYNVIFGAQSIRLEHTVSGRRTLFATMEDGAMTVQVDEFHGIHFEELLTDVDDDLPPLVAISSEDCDDDDDRLLTEQIERMGYTVIRD